MNKLKTGKDCLEFLGLTKDRWGHAQSGPVLIKLIEQYNIKSVVEIGSQSGGLSELMAKRFPDMEVQSIDINHLRPDLHKKYKNLTQLTMDSVEAAELLKDKSFDLVYIDADHSYDSVKSELEAWFPKCNKVLAGHDYKHGLFTGCTKAIDEFFSAHTNLKLNTEAYYNWWTALN